MKFSKSEGRHLVAKQKIVPGDVLIVDQPYISTLFRDHQPTHCYHCFRRLPTEPGDCVPSPYCDKVQPHTHQPSHWGLPKNNFAQKWSWDA